MTEDRRPHSLLWVLSELYYPEETSTGYYLTKLAEGLAARRPVRVVCGQPSYSNRGMRAPRDEVHNRVAIHRCWATTWNKDHLALRLVNLLTVSFSLVTYLLLHLRHGDRVLVVTNPPLLPFLVDWVCRMRGARCFLRVEDVYPEALGAAGLLSRHSRLARFLERRVRRLYRSVERIIVLGRDASKLVEGKLPPSLTAKLAVITNWADIDSAPHIARHENPLLARLGLGDHFVVQYSGNLGRTHNIAAIVSCAERLRHEPGIHFLVIGSGAKWAWLEQCIQSRSLQNVSLLRPCPRSELATSLNACDLSIIPFVEGMAGVSVPSRMYNVMAAGKPLIAMADHDSELARVVKEEGVGWVVPPDDIEGFARAVIEARSQPQRLQQMGRRAQRAVEQKYRLKSILEKYERLLDEALGEQERADRRRAAA